MRLMKPPKPLWIWQQPDWPKLVFDANAAAQDLAEAHRMHGIVEGKAAAIGLGATSPLAVDALADEALSTAAIEGERLARDAVRSSVMRRLGLAAAGPSDRQVEGLVEVLNDATTACDQPLDADRLWRWQSALFPGGTSGIRRIVVGRWRSHEDAMQIVSGPPGREAVHYEAPPSRELPLQMDRFLRWFAKPAPALDGLARAAIAHLWFESIHPFEDGNGRIGRAIADMALSQHLRQPVRLYSLSRQLLASRAEYYEALHAASRGGLDVTEWVRWFARQITAACRTASEVIDQAIAKRRFWEQHEHAVNERQRKVLHRLLDAGDGGFAGGLNAEKYIKLTGVSKATATRDLGEMVAHGQLWTAGTGKALRYYANMPGWTHGVERSGAVRGGG
jgi:Fic family protein